MKKELIVKKSGIILFWLLVWQLLAMGIHNPFLLETPLRTAEVFAGNIISISFWKITGFSLLRIGTGFGMGLLIGILVAVLCFRFRLAEELLSPLLHLIRAVPVVCFVVLFLIWWGSSFLSVAVSFLMVFPAICYSTLEGLRSVDRKQLEMAEIFRLPAGTVILYLYRPALRPFLMGGIRTALGLAWKSGVAAEIIGIPAYSIGEQIYLSKISLNTAEIFSWSFVVVILCILSEKGVLWLAEKLMTCQLPVKAPAPAQKQNQELRTDGLTIHFGDRELFQNYSMQVKTGEIRWMTWPSGQGKTTLLRVLAGLQKTDRNVCQVPESMGMLFQEDRLCEDYSAALNVELVTGEKNSAQEILKELLEEELTDKPCGELSGGEKRRVALARALAADNGVLLLDEPFAGLDAENVQRVWKVIREQQKGRTILIASHIRPAEAEIQEIQGM